MRYHVEFDIDFKRNPYKGRYIVIEGIDGGGKTTQVARLARYFKNAGKHVVITGEPRKSKGAFGKLIHEILLAKVHIPSVAFQYLFSADRAMHHEELVIPALKIGDIVMSDRCFWSAVPYGIMDAMLGKKEARYDYSMGNVILSAQSILSMYHQFMLPDITFYLDISVDTAMKRLGQKEQAKEIYEKRETLEKISLGYKWLITQFPNEFTVINGEKSEEEVTREIIKKIDNLK